MSNCWVECYTNPKKYDENLQSHFFLENRNFNCLSKLPIIVRVDRKRKKKKKHLEIFARELLIKDLNEIDQ